MKILVAPDSFKGSLEAYEICEIVEKSAKEIFKNAEVVKIPMADGGEGTVSAVLPSLNGEKIEVTVKSPDFRDIKATYGIFDGDKAIMEMAEASGITLVENRDILKMNTFGTGQMIIDALNRGVKTIYIGIGGSATNDLGIGFVSALGVKFLDKKGSEIAPIPENFSEIFDFDMSNINPLIKNAEFIIMSDVKNPLLGENGATHIFGRQKGATDEIIENLETGMTHLAKIIEKNLGVSIRDTKGAGAAGGLGFALLAFTNSKMQSGIDTIIDILDVEKQISDVDIVITGEGRMDNQSAFGKVPFGIGELSKKLSIPCFAIVGSLGKEYKDMYNHGITSIITCVDSIISLDEAIQNAQHLCENATERLLRFVRIHIDCE